MRAFKGICCAVGAVLYVTGIAAAMIFPLSGGIWFFGGLLFRLVSPIGGKQM